VRRGRDVTCTITSRPTEALEACAERAGFPEHGLVVRAEGPDDPRIWKELKDRAALAAAFADAIPQSKTGKVWRFATWTPPRFADPQWGNACNP